MTGSAVVLESVSKRYRLGDGSTLTAVDDVSLSVAPGTRVALLGASGSGKSTLLHLIGAIDAPDAGSIRVGDLTITGLTERRLADYRSGIGFVFQQFHLVPGLSLLDNVHAPLVGRPFAGDRRARARELLDAVGLGDRERALPSQLSGGQQQRVAIARAMVAHPGLLLADEPTGNLDSATAAQIMDLLTRLQADYDTTVLIATHDRIAAASCEVVYRISDGAVTEVEAFDSMADARPRRAVEAASWN
nr:ABC transporter ATP-binding protein [Propionicimonas sp.]